MCMAYLEKTSYRKTKSNFYGKSQFDSRKEAGEARNFDREVERGEIKGYVKQYRIDFYASNMMVLRNGDVIKLQDGQVVYPDHLPVILANPGDNERRYSSYLLSYYVDFKVEHNDGVIEFVEVKGLKSKDFKMKWALMEAVYGNDPAYQLTIIRGK